MAETGAPALTTVNAPRCRAGKTGGMLFFALKGAEALGHRIAAAGGLAHPLALHEERDFGMGEHKARPLVDVQGADVFVLGALQGGGGMSANDRLIRLLFFLATCRDHGAARVTAVLPYLPYSRKDRRTKERDPVSSRYVAQLIEAMGPDEVLTLDVHNVSAFENAFRCRARNLSAIGLFAADIAERARADGPPLAVMSPDPGGVKRAQLLREALQEATASDVGFAFREKRRSAGSVTGDLFAGDVAGCAVHIVDDMICGGGTILRAAATARENGAAEVHALATHALFTSEAVKHFRQDQTLDSITVTDSALPFLTALDPMSEKLRVLGSAQVISAAIRSIHDGTEMPRTIAPRVVSIDSHQ